MLPCKEAGDPSVVPWKDGVPVPFAFHNNIIIMVIIGGMQGMRLLVDIIRR